MTALAKAVQADHLFDGETVRHDHVVVIEDSCIASVLPEGRLPQGCPVERLPAQCHGSVRRR